MGDGYYSVVKTQLCKKMLTRHGFDKCVKAFENDGFKFYKLVSIFNPEYCSGNEYCTYMYLLTKKNITTTLNTPIVKVKDIDEDIKYERKRCEFDCGTLEIYDSYEKFAESNTMKKWKRYSLKYFLSISLKRAWRVLWFVPLVVFSFMDALLRVIYTLDWEEFNFIAL